MKRKGCREVDGVIEIRSGCMLLQLLRQQRRLDYAQHATGWPSVSHSPPGIGHL